jgi:SAM-dependent methyltransferase
LKESEDAHGRLMLEYLETGGGTEIIERDDGLVTASPFTPAAYFAEHRKWPAVERRLIRLARGRVLDVGAGAGRVALYLQERGLEVVAIDNSPGAIEVCRRRGVKDVRELPFSRIGPALGRFDTVLMFGNNFGLFASPEGARRLLRRLHSLTNEGARILATSRDPYATDHPDHLAYQEFNRRRGRMPGGLRVRVRHGRVKGPWFDYLIVSPDEMREILAGTGWSIRRVFPGEPLYGAVLDRDRAGTSPTPSG